MISIKYIVIGLMSIMLLASCGRAGSHGWYMSASHSERIEYYKDICNGFGYRYGTSGMTECVATEMRNKSKAATESLDKIADDLRGLGNSNSGRVTCQNYGSITNCRSY